MSGGGFVVGGLVVVGVVFELLCVLVVVSFLVLVLWWMLRLGCGCCYIVLIFGVGFIGFGMLFLL